MAGYKAKFFFASILALSVNSHLMADPKVPDTEAAVSIKDSKQTEQEAKLKKEMSSALFKIIEQTQGSMSDALGMVRSDLAEDLQAKTKQLLADPSVYNALLTMALERRKHDDDPKENAVYAAEAMSSLNGSLRLTPGVMSDKALVRRSKLLASVASYYSQKDPQMCRYLPSDFSILMNIDAPWLVNVDADLFHEAIDDEYAAIKLMISGVLPRNVNDSDKQTALSKFAGRWLNSLSEDDRYRVAASKQEGNYCDLWNSMLTDMVKMSDGFPDTTKKIMAPFLVSMTRGWMDSALWSYEATDRNQGDEK